MNVQHAVSVTKASLIQGVPLIRTGLLSFDDVAGPFRGVLASNPADCSPDGFIPITRETIWERGSRPSDYPENTEKGLRHPVGAGPI